MYENLKVVIKNLNTEIKYASDKSANMKTLKLDQNSIRNVGYENAAFA